MHLRIRRRGNENFRAELDVCDNNINYLKFKDNCLNLLKNSP